MGENGEYLVDERCVLQLRGVSVRVIHDERWMKVIGLMVKEVLTFVLAFGQRWRSEPLGADEAPFHSTYTSKLVNCHNLEFKAQHDIHYKRFSLHTSLNGPPRVRTGFILDNTPSVSRHPLHPSLEQLHARLAACFRSLKDEDDRCAGSASF